MTLCFKCVDLCLVVNCICFVVVGQHADQPFACIRVCLQARYAIFLLLVASQHAGWPRW